VGNARNGQSKEEEGEWALLEEEKARRVEATIERRSSKLFIRWGGVEEGRPTIAVCVLGEVSGIFQPFLRLIGRFDGHGRFVHVFGNDESCLH